MYLDILSEAVEHLFGHIIALEKFLLPGSIYDVFS